jgi:hypothetical protein
VKYFRLMNSDQKTEISEMACANVIKTFENKDCIICQSRIDIPAMLIGPLDCEDCGVQVYCIRCIRTHFEFNTPMAKRGMKKHVICQKMVDTSRLKSKKSYEILHDVIKGLDATTTKDATFTCQCEKVFHTRKDLLAHSKDGTCPMSYHKCIFCKDVFQNAEFVAHMRTTSGCLEKEIAYELLQRHKH